MMPPDDGVLKRTDGALNCKVWQSLEQPQIVRGSDGAFWCLAAWKCQQQFAIMYVDGFNVPQSST